MQATLKSVFVNFKDAKGTPFTTKKGDPYNRVVIETVNGNKASCTIWDNQPVKLAIAKSWRPGDTIEVNITQSGEYNNFDFYALETPRPREDSQNVQSTTSTTQQPLKVNTEANTAMLDEIYNLVNTIQKQNAVIIGMLQDQDVKETEHFVQENFGKKEIKVEDINI